IVDLPAGQIDRAVDILAASAVEGVVGGLLISIHPNSDTRNSGGGAQSRRSYLGRRARANVDRAIVRSGPAGQNEGDARPVDGAVAADRKVASVEDVGARIEVECGATGNLDPTAIDAGWNGFGFSLLQPVTGSSASGIGRDLKGGVGIGCGRDAGRQVARGGHDRTGRKRIAAGEKDISGAETRTVEQLGRTGLTGSVVQITGGQANCDVPPPFSEADGEFAVFAKGHHAGVAARTFQRRGSYPCGLQLAGKRAEYPGLVQRVLRELGAGPKSSEPGQRYHRRGC